MIHQKSFRCALIAALLLLSIPVSSQEPEPAQADAAAAEMSSHERTARELYRLSAGDEAGALEKEIMLSFLSVNPELEPYQDVIAAWAEKVFSTGDLEGEIAQVYMNALTEEELRGLIDFYKTPLGRKSLEVMPQVMAESAALGIRRAEEHGPELQFMLMKAMEERPPEPPAEPQIEIADPPEPAPEPPPADADADPDG